MSRSLRLILTYCALTVAACLVTLGVGLKWFGADAVSKIEFVARDRVLSIFSAPQHADQITLVDIDETSIRKTGPWPWKRSMIADLVTELVDRHGARLVVLDIVLPDPRDEAGDKRLLKLAENRKLALAQVFDYVDREPPIISGSPSGDFFLNLDKELPTISATGIIGNHTGLRSAPCVGNIGFIPDLDGKLRRIVLYTEWQDKIYPALSLASVLCLLETNKSAFKTKQVTYDQSATLQLKFNINPNEFKLIPAHNILKNAPTERRLFTSLVQDKIVIVGSSALGLSDRVTTPHSASISGMYIHAQAITEILNPQKSIMQSFSLPLTQMYQLAVVIAFTLTMVLSRNLWALITIGSAILLLWIGFTVLQIDAGNRHLLSGAFWGVLFLLLTLIPMEWSRQRAQSRVRARILSRYVSKPVLKDLLAQQNFDPLKPRLATISVLVADMVSYSQTVAEQSLDGAATITQEFLEAITEPVWSLRGTLDRYTGDGLIAFWGAPIPVQNHAELAVRAAIEMHSRVEALNEQNRSRGLPSVRLRIGIASGSALVGDFGTELRANYTAVGTCINMASRLESAAKSLGVSTLISEVTAGAVTQSPLTPFGEHEIRGLGRITLFTLNAPPASTESMAP